MYVELSNVSRNTSLSSVASGAGMSAADVADLSRRMRNVRAQLKRSQKEESLGEPGRAPGQVRKLRVDGLHF